MMRTEQDIVKRPLITEKGERGRAMAQQYAFEVHPDATKIQVKGAVEKLFGVHVLGVRTLIQRGKNKRVGRSMGRRSSWKKAIVTLTSSYDVVADPGSFIVTGTNAAIAPLFSAGIMLIPATLRPSNDNNPVGGAILSDWRFCNTFGVIDSQLTIRSDPGDLRTLILVGMGTGGDLFLERIQLNGITPVVSEQKFHVVLEAFIDPT